MNILYCRPAWATPIVREIPFDWRDFEPLARAEASKFYWRQERGQFRFEDLYSVAAEALADGKSANHARKCIKGALLDHARDGDKMVCDVELTPEQWRRTHSNIPSPRRDMGSAVANAAVIAVAERAAKRIPPGTFLGVKEDGFTRLFSPGPYRSNAQLLAGDGKPTKHGKVRCTIGRALYDDTWNQQFREQVSAGSSDEQSEQEAERLAKKDRIPQRGQLGGGKPKPSRDYKGGGRKQRWSKSCLSSGPGAGIEGAVLKSIPDLSPLRSVADRFFVGPFLCIREPAKSGDREADPALSKWSRDRYQLCLGPEKSGPSYIPRHVVAPPLLDIATSVRFGLGRQDQPAQAREARAIAKLLAEVVPAAEDTSPAKKAEAKKPALEREAPKFPAIGWHREAGSFPDLDEKTWGLPGFGVFCRGDLPYFGKKKDPWRRGKNIFASSSKISGLGGDYI